MSDFTTWRSLVDGEEVSLIPDSAVHRFDATDSGSIVQSDGTVTEWHDLEGDANLDNGSASGLGDINGNQAIQFDGNDDYLYHENLSESVTMPFTVITVIERSGSSNDEQRHFSDYNSFEAQLYWSEANENNNIFNSTSVTGTSTFDINVQTGIFDNSNSRIREDGYQTGSGDVGSGSLDGIIVGAVNAGERHLEGNIGYVGVYDADLEATGELEDEEQRVADKYGINI